MADLRIETLEETKQYIVVQIGNEKYGIDIGYVDNIVRMQKILSLLQPVEQQLLPQGVKLQLGVHTEAVVAAREDMQRGLHAVLAQGVVVACRADRGHQNLLQRPGLFRRADQLEHTASDCVPEIH